MHVSGMTLRAHMVPILIQLRPMQHVVVLNVLLWIKMKPMLSTLLLGPTVPSDREGLYPAVRKLDQILLQRIDAERVLDLKYSKLSIVTICLDEKLSILPE